jgi:hypothetical protein
MDFTRQDWINYLYDVWQTLEVKAIQDPADDQKAKDATDAYMDYRAAKYDNV